MSVKSMNLFWALECRDCFLLTRKSDLFGCLELLWVAVYLEERPSFPGLLLRSSFAGELLIELQNLLSLLLLEGTYS